MRYRLRSLVIGTAIAPPLIALAWFTAHWLLTATDFRHDWRAYLCCAAWLIVLGLNFFALAAPPYWSRKPPVLPIGYLAFLWVAQFAAVAFWIWAGIKMAFWTDMPTPDHGKFWWLYATLPSAYFATVTTARIKLRSVGGYYIAVVGVLVATLAILATLVIVVR
jgi:hypothetical protein